MRQLKKEDVLEITVESGAAESVMPNWYEDYPLKQTHKVGRGYRAASGSRIENIGQNYSFGK